MSCDEEPPNIMEREEAEKAILEGEAALLRLEANVEIKRSFIQTFPADLNNAGTQHREKWKLVKRLGNGATATVWKITCPGHEDRALKAITNTECLKELDTNDIKTRYKQELRSLTILTKFPDYFCTILGWWVENKELYILMPLMNGGNLEDAILDTDVETVKAVMKPLLHATEKMHGLGIIHGDLKPTNILRAKRDELKFVIADMGSSRTLISHDRSTVDGAYGYQAPELLAKGGCYNAMADMWSLGCITYFLLTRRRLYPEPKATASEQAEYINGQMIEHIEGKYLAKSFISSLVKAIPEERLTAAEVLKHRWLMQIG